MKHFFSGTLLSRISGLGRDLAMAFAFGDHPSVAAFMVAFRFSNLLRRLLGEGPFQSAFIPYFQGMRLQNQERATLFFRQLAFLMMILLVVITLLLEGGIATFLSFSSLSAEGHEIIYLTGWLFPGIIFICLYGLNLSLLNCYDSYFIPSFAPFICNLIWIVAALLLRHQDPHLAMVSLSQWVVIGFLGQWLWTFPLTLKHTWKSWKEGWSFSIPSEIKQLAQTFSLGAIGVGAAQINAFADAFFARCVDIRGPVYLWYSIRLEQLAFAIFGLACVTPIIPAFSQAIKKGDSLSAQHLFSTSYQRILFVMVSCTFAIFALGFAGVDLIYGHGNFSEEAVSKTTLCLFAYALGLIPSTLVILFAAIYQAEGNFKTPMFISLVVVIMNLILNAFFVFFLGLGSISIALATSLSAWANYAILWHFIKNKGWQPLFPFSHLCHILVAGGFAWLCVALSSHLFLTEQLSLVQTLWAKIAAFSMQTVIFVIVLAAYAVLCKNRNVFNLFKELSLNH